MAFLAQVTTLVYTAVLAPDSGLTPDLSRLAFGALLWIVLVILNRGTAGASPETLRPRGRSRAELGAAGDTRSVPPIHAGLPRCSRTHRGRLMPPWVATRRPSIPFNDLQPARSYLSALRRPAAVAGRQA